MLNYMFLFCTFSSGIHFDNPARTMAMVLATGVATLLWAWGDYGDDKPDGLAAKIFWGIRGGIRHFTKCDPSQQLKRQKMAFAVDIGVGILLVLAGLDLTHYMRDFRPIEMFYGSLIATAFTALVFEEYLPGNMRKVATILFAPCGVGQISAGIVNNDPYVLAGGLIQSFGNIALYYSSKLKEQIKIASVHTP